MKKKRRLLVKDIDKWYEKNTDHSMSYFHKAVKVDPFNLTFQDQYSFTLWLSWMSLKLCYLTEIVKDKIVDVSKKKRLLIFSQWSMTQWLVKRFLSLLELKILLIQSHHSAIIRVSTIKMFNDYNADVDFLFSSLQISWEGTNFHWACHIIIHMKWVNNMSTILQVNEHIHHLEQTEEQEIIMLI